MVAPYLAKWGSYWFKKIGKLFSLIFSLLVTFICLKIINHFGKHLVSGRESEQTGELYTVSERYDK